MSIFINVSSENPKFLVFYDDRESNTVNLDNENKSKFDESDSETSIKRVKLGFDAFTKKLK